jgi:hypothetical protein
MTHMTMRRGVEAMNNKNLLLYLTVYGAHETWEESPAGWPQWDIMDTLPPRDVASPSGPA